ncbi:MAG: 4-(cytidine 5'-diphospho)-2-C-methyl-D-erythritol kinase [Desulfobulbaceae bacterium]|nr:4-(cytidine 5'-diphospho)-2-C-methyl-D-erythritol kinase [Desulfobulbaceae bacterium]
MCLCPVELTIAAPAKINLSLKVLRRRPDGYHELESVMQKLALADELSFRRQGAGISLECSDPGLPGGEENLVWRAARMFLEYSGSPGGVWIRLEKRIPVAAGLGGGSSDAAAVLVALNRLFGSGLDEEQLAGLGLRLGADVPFFVRSAGAALARGIGERLTSAAGLTSGYVLLVNPGFAVSTRWVYENLALTSGGNPYILAPNSGALNSGNSGPESIDFLTAPDACFLNDLEVVTIAHHPVIGEIKQALLDFGARAALMSGSGPTVFGCFLRLSEAQTAYRHFQYLYPDTVFLTEPWPV